MGLTTSLRDLSLWQLVLWQFAIVSASQGSSHMLDLLPRDNLNDKHVPESGNHTDLGDGLCEDDRGHDPPWHQGGDDKGGNHGSIPEPYVLTQHYHAKNMLDSFKFMTVGQQSCVKMAAADDFLRQMTSRTLLAPTTRQMALSTTLTNERR